MLTVSILIYICLRDLRFHIISNRSLLALSLSLYFISDGGLNLIYGLIALISLTILATKLSIGGGDIKLVAVLLIFGDNAFSFSNYLLISMLIGAVHLLFQLSHNRTIAGRLPLAPTIAGPMLLSLALQ